MGSRASSASAERSASASGVLLAHLRIPCRTTAVLLLRKPNSKKRKGNASGTNMQTGPDGPSCVLTRAFRSSRENDFLSTRVHRRRVRGESVGRKKNEREEGGRRFSKNN